MPKAQKTLCVHRARIQASTRPVSYTHLDVYKRQDKQLRVELTPAAKTFIVDSGYDPIYGARPLKRFIQSKVETLIAKKILQADVKPRETLLVDLSLIHI